MRISSILKSAGVMTLVAVVSLFILWQRPGQAKDAGCCRVSVKGCNKQANVCLPGSCDLDNQKKARDAFGRANNCQSTSVSSYIGTCSGEKCELDLR